MKIQLPNIRVPGMLVPEHIYFVLREPALLAGMQMPRSDTPWSLLSELDFCHVVRLAKVTPCFDPHPLRLLCDVDLDDLANGGLPDNPEAEAKLIEEVARQITGCLRAGEGVLVHCVGGRGRTGTVIGRVLRALGYPAAEVVGCLDQIHKNRGRSGWPESPWQQKLVQR
jgi:protein-tyrosine phosphatase